MTVSTFGSQSLPGTGKVGGELTGQDETEDGRGQQLRVAQVVGVAAAGDVDAVLAQPVVLLRQVVQLLPDAPAVVRQPVLPHVALEEGQQGALLGWEAQQGRRSHQVWRQKGGDHQILRPHSRRSCTMLCKGQGS